MSPTVSGFIHLMSYCFINVSDYNILVELHFKITTHCSLNFIIKTSALLATLCRQYDILTNKVQIAEGRDKLSIGVITSICYLFPLIPNRRQNTREMKNRQKVFIN